MPNEISTVQSLKAVDAWIDVINANINGGVRTAYKSSRLKFGGTNANVARTGTTTSLPLQFPEPGLMTANSVIDFSQGAITSSTENTHLAIQGTGFFAICDPGSVGVTGTYVGSPVTKFLLTRDGEFHANQNGALVTSFGFYLMARNNITTADWRIVYNNIDNTAPSVTLTTAVRLSDYLTGTIINGTTSASGVPLVLAASTYAIGEVKDLQDLQFSTYGSTVFDPRFDPVVVAPVVRSFYGTSTSTILTKSLEASNASMTQSVPELSLAQKLFSALTKILQTSATDTDSVLNLVR